MTSPTLRRELQAAVDACTTAGGNQTEAARVLGVSRSTLQTRLAIAERSGIEPSKQVVNEASPAAQIKRLTAELAAAQARALSDAAIKRQIIQLASDVAKTATPAWCHKLKKSSSPGVPTLFLSDLHWGEVVQPAQINGVNEYSLDTARRRLRKCAERAEHLLRILSPTMDYPGIVVALGGDMISGNIHDELTATNEANSMPCVLDLFTELGSFISTLADRFGAVFLPCVTGNHGRDTKKIWSKDRHATSFDWLLYSFLAKHFEAAGDKRVTFLIPDGPDAYYRVYEHRYLLTHGDQFRGGDGMIGALGPIIRGDHKKRSRNAQINMTYDTMLMGHWHQYIHLSRLVVNGSLKGYDEYAYDSNFGFEHPQQALWVTHPKYRITYRMPVFVDNHKDMPEAAWVSVPK